MQPSSGTGQTPTGGMATGGGGTAGTDEPFGSTLPFGAVAFLAILVAGGGLWRYRAQAHRVR